MFSHAVALNLTTLDLLTLLSYVALNVDILLDGFTAPSRLSTCLLSA